MKVSIIQTDLAWEDKERNLEHISELASKADSDIALLVLPEMFTTGFSMNAAKLAESMTGKTVEWMKSMSAVGGYAVCGSAIITSGEQYYNRSLFVTPDGKVSFYDKRHLHSMSGEDKVYTKGHERVVCGYLNFGFSLQVCYDLRFPVWARNRGETDVIIYSANWPALRNHVWKTLLAARAIENQCYVIGANRTGYGMDGTAYIGESVILDPKGRVIAAAEPCYEGLITADIDRTFLEDFRSSMPVWKDADPFTLR